MCSVRSTGLIMILASSLAACGAGARTPRPSAAPGRTITAHDIERLGASDAWDVLRRTGISLYFTESSAGAPAALRGRRGGAPAPTVHGATTVDAGEERAGIVLDGVATTDLSVLRSIPAGNIVCLRLVLDPNDMPAVVPGVLHPVALIYITTRRQSPSAPAC